MYRDSPEARTVCVVAHGEDRTLGARPVPLTALAAWLSSTGATPAAVRDRDAGRVRTWLTWSLGPDHESRLMTGTSDCPHRVFVSRIDDGGGGSLARLSLERLEGKRAQERRKDPCPDRRSCFESTPGESSANAWRAAI